MASILEKRALALATALLALALPAGRSAEAQTVPSGFTDEIVFDGNQVDIKGIFCLRFAPDGRMFFSEWRRGNLRVATYNAGSGTWTLLSQPFHAFRTPDSVSSSPTARRGTLRGFDFDPNFASNGYIYATYMHDSERSGYRIVRIKASSSNPNRSDGGEDVFLKCQFHPNASQPDAHNGGGLVVGGDNKLYVSFGDGWTTSSSQDMTVFAGKIVRLNLDGSIPSDNIWRTSLTGNLRYIVALGQRNPICLTRHPVSGRVYVNGFTGSNKSAMHQTTQGANYQHGGTGGGGTPTGEWINTTLNASGSSWATWYPAGGPWPSQYHNNAFVVNWNGNGEILRVSGGENNPSKSTFATNLKRGALSSVAVDVGPDGHLYYTIREYGELTHLRRIRYTSAPPPQPTVSIAVDATTVTEGNSTVVRINRSGDTSASITVNLSRTGSAGPGSDYTGIPTSVTLSAGATQATRTLSVTDDTETEGDETATIQVQSGTGYTVGSPSSVSVTIPANDQPLRDPDTPGQTEAGLAFDYHHLTSPTTVADLDASTPQSSGLRSTFDITTPDGRADNFGFVFTGFIQAASDGVYEFQTASDDGSTFDIGAVRVVDNDGTHAVQTQTGSIGLKTGLHAFTVRFFEAGGGESLTVSYKPPGAGGFSAIPNSAIRRSPSTGAPYGLTTRGSIGAYLDGAFPTSPTGSLPSTLSATGTFTSLTALTPRSGVNPYTVNSPLWSDDAVKLRWIAVPDGQTVTFSATGGWDFPTGTVLVKHFELPTDENNPGVLTRLETRFLIKNGASSWYGVTYLWRSSQTEADLLGAAGATQTYTIQTAGGGSRQQTWTFPSRGMCLQCHTSTAGFALGVNTRQLNGDYYYDATAVTDNQLRSWSHVGLFNQTLSDPQIGGFDALVPVTDTSASLEHRVRSYLDANCAQCHHPGGPGQGNFDARFDTPLASQGIVDGSVQQTLGIEGAVVVKPQDPWRSMLYQRMDLRGPSEQMPTIGTNERDADALNTVLSWIYSLSGTPALAPPQISPAPGTYSSPLTVTASHTDSNAVLRYTLDGTVPTSSSPAVPAAGLILTSNATVRVNAWRSGYATSVSSQASYVVQGGGGGGGGGTTLPSPWQGIDIGAVGPAGSGSESGGTFTLSGSGADIWGNQDAFYYAYVTLSGDGSVIARVASQENTNAWAKAGVMLRETLQADSKHAMMVITPGNGLSYQRRTSTGGTSTSTAGGAASPPWWVRIERSGDLFTAYASSDGINWTIVGSETILMAGQVFAGLAVTSHDNTVTSEVLFDGIMVVQGQDSDGDGMTDAAETSAGWDPADADEDGDGISDGLNDWDGNGVPNFLQVPASGGGGGGGGSGGGGGGSGSGGSCGATGLESVLVLGFLALLRRKRPGA